MNGRMYDPVLARFLSPDPYVQMPDFTQSFNRYAYCLNNPFKFTDPSGEFVWFVPIIVGAFIGAIQGHMMASANGATGLDMVGYVFGGAIVGASAGVAGAYVGTAVAAALPFAGFAGGVISGAAGGFVGGFIGGAGNAWLGDASFGQGLLSGLKAGGIGALTGGLISGLDQGLSAAMNGYSFWDGSKIVEFEVGDIYSSKNNANLYNNSKKAIKNDIALKQRIQTEFNIKKGKLGINTITTKTGENYGLTDNNTYYKLSTKQEVGGYIKRYYGIKWSDIHISPHYANGSRTDFRAIVGHELIHVIHNYYIPNYNTVYSERVAYKYTYDTYIRNGMTNQAIGIMQIAKDMWFWGNYPANYSIPMLYGIY
jgi:hypothetical protein